MELLKKINMVISKCLQILMIVLFIWMIVALSIQVFGRYLFSTGFTWTEEGARYGMIWMVFLGTAYIVLNSDHVKVSVLEDILKGAKKKALLILQDIISLIFVAFIFWFSIGQVKLASMGTSVNTGLNNAVPYAVFPISMAVCIWAYIYRLICFFVKKESQEQEGGKE